MKSYVLCAMIVLLSGLSALRPQAVADHQNSATVPSASSSDNTDSGVDESADITGALRATQALIYQQDAETDVARVTPALIYERNASPRSEAVVDMSFLFKNDPVFREQQEQLKAETAAGQTEMAEIVQEMRSITVQLQSLTSDDERAAREALESAIAELRTTMDARNRSLRQRLIQSESEMYFATYQRISAAIADHARENDIQIVRRSRSVAEFTRDPDTSSTETDGLEMSFPNRQTIMQMINRDIVYMEDGPVDITQAVLHRLTREPGSNAGSTAR